MHYINYLLVIALVFIVCKMISNKKAGLSKAIEPCKFCGAPGQLSEDYFDFQVICTNPCCAMAGPKGYCEIEAVALWNNLPSMATVVAWQFQAAGLELALQREKAVVDWLASWGDAHPCCIDLQCPYGRTIEECEAREGGMLDSSECWKKSAYNALGIHQ